MDKKQETRQLVELIKVRSVQENEDNTTTLEGYIAKFNSTTTLWSGYNEQIDAHAFDNTLADGHNIMLLYAHDWSKPMACTGNGSLALNADDMGLHFIATVDTSISYIADTVALIKSGITAGCSFGFYILNDNESYDASTDTYTDTILEIQLLEGSVLCNPQYTDTTVSARGKERIEELHKEKERALLKQKILIELEL
ncbi:HK97 family phage prohead protease [Clostridium felsineum]|uniref:Prohead serine protease domain-containing protein n=1 Tax=Clostridium felsineum TaxID=36839 RepID=A0A1S8M2I2_9CLOT|nr:HK97 family phage prohead protease [Clostridium felsineum]URZ06774.1 hypothetical protein CLROS_021070 [Clostridium felsineum]URZ11806.1 hypothetical protein CROST_025230 [Clostridium felsineum]